MLLLSSFLACLRWTKHKQHKTIETIKRIHQGIENSTIAGLTRQEITKALLFILLISKDMFEKRNNHR